MHSILQKEWDNLTELCLEPSFPLKSQPTQLRILKLSNERSCGSIEFPNQSFRQIGKGVNELCSDIQTNRDYYFTYTDGKIISNTEDWNENYMSM